MAKKYKITLVGHFAEGKDFNDGQTVKTRNLYKALANQYGDAAGKKVDTCGFLNRIIPFVFENAKSFLSSSNTIIVPAHNGVKIFVPFFSFLNFFFKRKLSYAVVGGWLPEFLNNHKKVSKMLKKFSGIYVETGSMKTDLEKQGFTNVYLLPNFKYITPLTEDKLVYNEKAPHSLCIFSRIMQQKGVEDAIEVVKQINNEAGNTVFTLDLYGPVDTAYIERFEEVKANMPEYVSYKGVIDSEKSVDAIKNYFALIFPTKFYTEGVPGTLIDAMAAGVPTISSLWVNHKDVFVEGVTGWGYEFDNTEQFKALLLKAAENPEEFLKMKTTALKQTEKYQPDKAISELIKRID